MSEADRAHYLETTSDKGNKRCVAALNLAVTMPGANQTLQGLISVLFIRNKCGEVDFGCNPACDTLDSTFRSR